MNRPRRITPSLLVPNWRLSTRLIVALAIAMLPMGLLAVTLAVRSFAEFGNGRPTFAQALSMSLPILMWLAAVWTGWFAVRRLVVIPLEKIQYLMDDYGHSTDPARSQLRIGGRDHGSNELASLAASFDSMADQIDQHSRDLRGAIGEQQRLTREVHHRVKNNLQIISSLLSLQAHAADTPEIALAYAAIQARITALAQVHRWMYDDVTTNGVDLRALIADLCANLESSLVSPDHRSVAISFRAAAIVIHPDTAVPIAFLITELASLAAVHSSPGTLEIELAATQEDASTTISVTAAAFIAADRIAAEAKTPTARIINGMVRQLRTSLVHDPARGRYCVTFDPAGTAPVA